MFSDLGQGARQMPKCFSGLYSLTLSIEVVDAIKILGTAET